jgi:uncharacterized phage-associated protein
MNSTVKFAKKKNCSYITDNYNVKQKYIDPMVYVYRTPPYRSSEVANYFLEQSFKEKTYLTLNQLHLFIYLAHGYYLANYESPLLSESIYVTKDGFKTYEIEYNFDGYGIYNNITEYIYEISPKLAEYLGESFLKIPSSDSHTNIFLNQIWLLFKDIEINKLFDDFILKNPFYKKFDNFAKTTMEYSYAKGNWKLVIDDKYIKEYFKNLLKLNKA